MNFCYHFSNHARFLIVDLIIFETLAPWLNREYLAPQIRSMNNRFHLEAKLPWSYDYPLANHIAKYKSSDNPEVSLFSRLYPSFEYHSENFPTKGFTPFNSFS